MLLQAEFLAIALVMVYVGAVMVLFLFVVMMLDINLDRLREGFWSYLPVGALVGILMLVAEMVMVLGGRYFGLEAMPAPAPVAADYSNTRELGRFSTPITCMPFELASLVLLVAMVAASRAHACASARAPSPSRRPSRSQSGARAGSSW
jgi:NADH-quinone oxidoreductase subunit J